MPVHDTEANQTSSKSGTVDPLSAKMSAALQDVLAAADQHFDENQFQEAVDVLLRHPDQTLAEIKWRRARAMFKLSRCDGAAKADLIREAYVLVADAVAQDEANFACHKWMAILLDAKSELDGIKARVQQLETVKRHMERAVELNGDDPTGWHLLGNFAFGLADMAWYQRKIVSTIFATPPTGTYEEALGHFLTAEERKANFYSMNLLLIGKCYAALKDTAKAKEYLERAANVKVLNEDDKRCKEEATGLLKKY